MKKQFLFFGLLTYMILQSQNLYAQLKIYQFEQLESLQKIEKRTVVIFIHTEWCKYCQAMKNTTLKNDSIVYTLNKQFYFIDLNAEEKSNINFNGHTFKYKPSGLNTGIHELAEQLATVDKQVSYPTLCFINSNSEIIFQYNQFITSTDLQTILTQLK